MMFITKNNTIKAFMGIILVYFLFSTCSEGDIKNQENTTLRANAKKAKTEIKFLGTWKGEGGREKFIKSFVREYNFENQETNVVLSFPDEILKKYGGDEVKEKESMWIKEQLYAEQSEYDIVLIYNQPELINDEPGWAAKYLVDFSKIEEFRNNTKSELLSDSIKKIWGGIIPGPFVEGYYFALWCNIDVAKKVGVEVKQFGMTFNDFFGYIKAVSEYNEKHQNEYIYPILDSGNDWKTLPLLFNQLYMSHLNNDDLFFHGSFSEHKLEAWHKALKDLERLQPYYPLSKNWDTISWGNTIYQPLEGKCLFYSNGSWMYNRWQLNDEEKLKNMMPVEYPVVNPVNFFIGGYNIFWAVPKNAPHKEEAIKFLLALNKAKYAEKWVRYTKCPTGIKGKLASVSLGVDKFEDFTYNIINKYKGRLYITGDSRHIFDNEHIWDETYGYDVLNGKMSADEAIARIREEHQIE